MKTLDDVTLLAVSSIYINETINALLKCNSTLNFKEVKLITHECPNNLPAPIKYEKCPKIENIEVFNSYVYSELYKHVDTSHCLMVQFHAYIVRPELWDDNWLQYDYIGAPWPIKDDAYITSSGERVRVGNGGFSLRSKKLLEIPTKYGIPLTHDRGFWNEDGNICVYHRDKFKELGIKYAPVDVASIFSYENDVPENKDIMPFGFHKNIK